MRGEGGRGRNHFRNVHNIIQNVQFYLMGTPEIVDQGDLQDFVKT